MQVAKVIGHVVATVKDPALTARKLLVLQPLKASGGEAVGDPVVGIDSVGAGVGEEVMFVRGREASFIFLPDEVPADVGIVGKVDNWDDDPR